MPKDARTIISDFNAHIKKRAGQPSEWYVGVTEDIDGRLFGRHAVPRKGHWYIYREAYTTQDARAVEKAFLDSGCDGGGGGGDEDARFVYAYLKTSITDP